MAKLKFLDFGDGADQLNLGTLPDTSGAGITALSSGTQAINGAKNFPDGIHSPNSPDTDNEKINDDEVVTREQASDYLQALATARQDIIAPIDMDNANGISLPDVPGVVWIYDPATGLPIAQIVIPYPPAEIPSVPTNPPPEKPG